MKHLTLDDIRISKPDFDASKKVPKGQLVTDWLIAWIKHSLEFGIADIGDYTRAEKIFDELVGLAESDKDEVYEYITMLAFKLNRAERNDLYEHYVTLNRETEFSNFVKLFRIW